MVAAAGVPGDPLQGRGQAAIALRDEVNQLVDLLGRFGRGLDFDPAADALEDRRGVERVGCRHVVSDTASFHDAQFRTGKQWHIPEYEIIKPVRMKISADRGRRGTRSARPARRWSAAFWNRRSA